MKYGIWKVSRLEAGAVNALVGSGYAPLAAMVLASRGMEDDHQARAYLDCNAPLLDPFLMTDMDKAAGRVGLAMSRGEKIAVFGDFDVDGISATCLLSLALRELGGKGVEDIPKVNVGNIGVSTRRARHHRQKKKAVETPQDPQS